MSTDAVFDGAFFKLFMEGGVRGFGAEVVGAAPGDQSPGPPGFYRFMPAPARCWEDGQPRERFPFSLPGGAVRWETGNGAPSDEASVLLAAVGQGDSKAAEELLGLVYDELRHLAAAKMAQQAPGQTLQPTALVHEAWLRLVGDKNPTFRNSTHFFAAAAEAMRHDPDRSCSAQTNRASRRAMRARGV